MLWHNQEVAIGRVEGRVVVHVAASCVDVVAYSMLRSRGAYATDPLEPSYPVN
jgi:hypothetical protein